MTSSSVVVTTAWIKKYTSPSKGLCCETTHDGRHDRRETHHGRYERQGGCGGAGFKRISDDGTSHHRGDADTHRLKESRGDQRPQLARRTGEQTREEEQAVAAQQNRASAEAVGEQALNGLKQAESQ